MRCVQTFMIHHSVNKAQSRRKRYIMSVCDVRVHSSPGLYRNELLTEKDWLGIVREKVASPVTLDYFYSDIVRSKESSFCVPMIADRHHTGLPSIQSSSHQYGSIDKFVLADEFECPKFIDDVDKSKWSYEVEFEEPVWDSESVNIHDSYSSTIQEESISLKVWRGDRRKIMVPTYLWSTHLYITKKEELFHIPQSLNRRPS